MVSDAIASSSYDLVCYSGDNVNDLCPGLRALGSDDLLCPRAGFPLEKLIEGRRSEIKATVVPWTTGEDILRAVKERVLCI